MLASYRQKVTSSKLGCSDRAERLSLLTLTTPLGRIDSRCHNLPVLWVPGLQRGSRTIARDPPEEVQPPDDDPAAALFRSPANLHLTDPWVITPVHSHRLAMRFVSGMGHNGLSSLSSELHNHRALLTSTNGQPQPPAPSL